MNLVYYTIGGDPNYSELLDVSIQSLRKNCNMYKTHVMVMCSEAYLPNIKSIQGIDDVMLVEEGKNAMELSMKKACISRYSSLNKYQRVMFLDCDIVVVKDIITDFLDGLDSQSHLYVCTEHHDPRWHREIYFSLQNYTPLQLRQLAERKQAVFNCGQFAFCVSDAMKQHFTAIEDMMKHHQGKFYYEQSFMNVYFNTRGLTIPSMTSYVQMPLITCVVTNNSNAYIIHFASPATIKFPEKLAKMKAALSL